jgi:plastocyanin
MSERKTKKRNQVTTAVIATSVSTLVSILRVPLASGNFLNDPTALAGTDASVPGSNTVEVQIVGHEDLQLSTTDLNIHVGDSIKFVNLDGYNGVGLEHRVYSVYEGSMVADGMFDTGIIQPGGTYVVTFDHTGTFQFVDWYRSTVETVVVS